MQFLTAGRRSLRGENGGTAPEAFPKEISVPFFFNALRLLSNLDTEISTQNGFVERSVHRQIQNQPQYHS